MTISDPPQKTTQATKQVARKNGQSIQGFINISAYKKPYNILPSKKMMNY